MEISGAEAVVKVLEELKVKVIFGYPGGANLPLYDALYHSTSIQHILARHEQGAGLMANGYGRILNAPGVCLATSGPGVTNLVTALADAYLDSVPMVALTGQIASGFIGTDAFQEVDTFNLTLPITKHNELVFSAEDIVPALRNAFLIANTGRKGPVLVDIPRDLQEHKAHYDLKAEKALPGYSPTDHAHIGQIKRAVRALKKAERPLFLLGGGVLQAQAQQVVLALAERLKVPVVRTLMGKTAFPETHPLYLGMIGTHGNVDANKAIAKADLIMVIGSRLGDRSTFFKKDQFAHHAKIIHLDIDPAEIGKTVRADIPIVGDIQTTLERFLAEISPEQTATTPWMQSKTTSNVLWKGDDGGTIGSILQELSKLDSKLHITTDVGRHQMWATHFCTNPKHWPILTSGGLGTMGFGLPAAIGAWFADPKTPVVNISGDGSFYMNLQEFAIAVEHQIPLIVFIINDSRLGMIKEIQEGRYGGRAIAHNFPATNFVGLAEAFGGKGYKLTKLEQVLPTLKKAIGEKTPTLIDVDLPAVAKSEASREKLAQAS